MTVRRRPSIWRWWYLVVTVLAAQVALPAGALAAPPGAGESYLKYYVVTSSYQGEPENLARISRRFLGTADRADDIFDLNVGRRQADGGALADPAALRPGWLIVLPWDAVGEGVRNGLLSAAQLGAGPGSGPPGGSTTGTAVAPPAPAGNTGAGVRCGAATAVTTTAVTTAGSDWAIRRMDPQRAWQRGEGDGVMVAVVDSGVDGALRQLAGRVAVGVDITAGSARGDSDCLGSGTAMAGIIAGRSVRPGDAGGMAPAATVLPVRVVGATGPARSTDVETGIQVAVSAGARVIALGDHVTLDDPVVAKAVSAALSHDVVVVAGATVTAPTGTGATSPPTEPAPAADAALLRVGGVGADGRPAAGYRPGAVHLVAPGVDVASLAAGTGAVRAGSGTPYAVAFVAGTVALVRAAFPNLGAAQVAYRIRATAERTGTGGPDPSTGWGMVDPGAAVTAVLPEEGRPAAPAPEPGGPGPVRVAVVVVLVLLLAVAAALLARRARRTRVISAVPVTVPLVGAAASVPLPSPPPAGTSAPLPSPPPAGTSAPSDAGDGSVGTRP
ncbi:S8 family serine peptidase [Micromonospora sp. NPDC050397]|uniref:S8 family serine peptidase n=1 Tax=Micromonospora sp. NPDC050397 TaxID=3364279 RepID=UPI00384FB596